MAKITYSSLKLKTNTETNKVEGTDIEVLKYLPIEEKISLINIALQNAKEGTIYNSIKLDAYFHLYLVMMYSNISFTEKQKEDPIKLYDTLKSNGLLDKIILAMEEEEYNYLLECLNQQEEDIYLYQNSTAGIISNAIDQLPVRAEQLSEIVENFNPEKFQNVLDFAKAANGGNSIV
jgi:hypothetical protein